VKHFDPEIFKKHTGGDLNLTKKNPQMLAEKKVPVRARIPVIYSFNHDEKTIENILNFIESLGNITVVDFLPYHHLRAESIICPST